MDNGRRNGLWFLFGIAAGVTAGLYLNSEEGRKARRQAGDQINEFGRDLEGRAKDQYEQLSSNVNEYVDRGKHYVDDVGTSIKNRVNRVANQSESMVGKTKNRYNANVEKAKRKIRKRIRKLEETIENEMG